MKGGHWRIAVLWWHSRCAAARGVSTDSRELSANLTTVKHTLKTKLTSPEAWDVCAGAYDWSSCWTAMVKQASIRSFLMQVMPARHSAALANLHKALILFMPAESDLIILISLV